MGRRPIGKEAMSAAERQQKRRDRLRDNPVEAILELASKLDQDQLAELSGRLKLICNVTI